MKSYTKLVATALLAQIIFSTAAEAIVPRNKALDTAISESLVLLNKQPNARAVLATYETFYGLEAVAGLRTRLEESKVNLEEKLPAVSYQKGVFKVEGLKQEIELLNPEKLEYRIDGVRWNYDTRETVSRNHESLVKRLRASSGDSGWSFFPVAQAAEDKIESPRSLGRELTLDLAALAVISGAVAATIFGVAVTVPAIGVPLAALVGPFTALGINIGIFGGLVAALYWGGSKLLSDLRFGKATVYCKNKILYAKMNGKEIRIDRDTLFGSSANLSNTERRAVEHFLKKYDCKDTLAGAKWNELLTKAEVALRNVKTAVVGETPDDKGANPASAR